ncbi:MULTISPECIES: hypothetical protein [unclassified Streptomyces]|uniref:hypothetical protein n=1 Tax=unclassified Streptomyces TaxID=2593676 RepID=UPI000DACA684|nr:MULTISPECIES: hypothetical protein [unclassified Streptomyces]PZT74301.1 hypothetical protein DNK55_19445 [Streptomyces sp. AC1-42T]PZT82709.1 hypothetical protein DNK56_11995 [Streptomyces sp. AC1-42W]
MITLAVTVGLAFAGFVITYLNGLRLAQRQERLARVNRQLSDLYGPLFAPTEANSRIFAAFLERNARADGRSPFAHETPPTDEELAEWRLWVTTVFLPNIRAMRDLVLGHADLLREPVMPPLLLQLCAHVSGYEITAARWAQGGYEHHLSVVPFPAQEVAVYARRGFSEVNLTRS